MAEIYVNNITEGRKEGKMIDNSPYLEDASASFQKQQIRKLQDTRPMCQGGCRLVCEQDYLYPVQYIYSLR